MQEALQFVLTGSVIIAAVAWLIRSLVSHLLDKDVQKYKEALRGETEVTLERLRADLRDREFVFRTFHETRASVVSELYKRMAKAVRAVRLYLESGPIDQIPTERFQEAQRDVASFAEFFEEHRIWLDPTLAERIEKLLVEHSQGILHRFYNIQSLRKTGLAKDWSDEEIQRLWRKTKEDVPQILRSLEAEFRKALGVADEGP